MVARVIDWPGINNELLTFENWWTPAWLATLNCWFWRRADEKNGCSKFRLDQPFVWLGVLFWGDPQMVSIGFINVNVILVQVDVLSGLTWRYACADARKTFRFGLADNWNNFDANCAMSSTLSVSPSIVILTGRGMKLWRMTEREVETTHVINRYMQLFCRVDKISWSAFRDYLEWFEPVRASQTLTAV